MKNKGQSAIEYFVIFSVIALLTILSFSSFFPRIQEAMQGEVGYFQRAAQQIISPTLVTQTPTPLTTSSTPPPPTPPTITQLAPGLPPLTPEPLLWQPPSMSLIVPPTVTTDPDIIAALNLLNSTELGAYYAQLIIDHNISIVFMRYPGSDSRATATVAGNWTPGNNTISLADNYRFTADHAGMASILAHEAVHADYTYNPQRWIDYLSRRHPEVSSNSIPRNSIDQEYNAVSLQVLTLQAIQGTPQLTPSEARRLLRHNLYYQREDYLKDLIRGTLNYGVLPEY